MNTTRHDDMNIAEQAAHWVSTLDGADPAEQATFETWLRQSERHVEEFLLASAIFRSLDGLDPHRRIDVQRLKAEGLVNVVSIKGTYPVAAETSTFRRRQTLPRWALGAAAILAGIVIMAGWQLWDEWGWQSYRTATGEQRIFELEDGSTLHLNTQSEVKMRFLADERDVRLVAGEAMFKVVHSPDRPFYVYAGTTAIQAVGTQFNVYRRAQDVTVSVIEGIVKVSPAREVGETVTPRGQPVTVTGDAKPPITTGSARLHAGEQASISRSGQIQVSTGDTTKVNAWLQRRLVFRNDRLADVADEFNRYNRVPQIRIEGPALGERRLTGVFDADAPESLLRFLADFNDLSVQKTETEFVIRNR